MYIDFTTRGLLSHFFRQGQKVTAIFLFIVLSGITYLNATKPLYEVEGSLLVKFGQNAPAQITHTDMNASVISQDDRREIMQSNMDILQSQNLLLALVNEIGAEKLYPGIIEKADANESPLEAAVRRLAKTDLNIKSGQFSNVITIKVQNENPQIAARFVRRLMEMFIARQAEIYNKPQTGFLAEQVKQSAEKLEDSQRQLEDFKAQKGISSLEQELAELQRQKSDAGTASLEPMDSAWDKLSDLESEEKRLLAIYQPDSPQVLRAHQNVALAQTQLNNRQGDLRARTNNALAKINKRIALLEKDRSRYNDLARQVEMDEKNYKNYQTSSEEAHVNENMSQKNITSVVVVDEPVVPVKPAYPRKAIVITLSLLSGLVASLGIALVFETFDQRFTAPEQVIRTLGVPVMASFNRSSGRSA